MKISDPAAFLRTLFDAAIAAAQPARCVPPHLPPPPHGRLIVVGAGKASAAMARAVEDHWPGPLVGLVVTRYGYEVACRQIEIVGAAHPVPDAAGFAAAGRMLDLVRGLSPDDLVLALISGGGSALLPLPDAGITLDDKQHISRALLACGAAIGEINCVRRHLSAIKGGRLAAACHPAVADPTTCADALAILRRYRIDAPPRIYAHLESGRGESVKPGDLRIAAAEARLIAAPQLALEAAAALARAAGIDAHILSDAVEGESREVGKVMAALALHIADRDQPLRAPCILLSGGETTVTVRGRGRGGRNVEFLLALALALGAHPRIHALAGDTDGVDGQDEIAGAIVRPETLARAWALGLPPRASLDANDGHGFFAALGDSVVTGPTLTNVNDFRAILIE
jgi:hydroxypyruvate reductase